MALDGSGDSLKFWHNGGNDGFACYMVAYGHKGSGAVIMTNGDGGGFLMMEIRSAIARAYHWDDYQPQVYKPLADQEQNVTAKLMRVISLIQQGQVDTDDLTPGFQRTLRDEYLQAYQGALNWLEGTPSVVLIGRDDSNLSSVLKYRAQFGRAIAVLHITVTKDQLIDNLGVDGIFLTRTQ